MSLETELRLLGIIPTKQQVEKIRKVAVEEERWQKVEPKRIKTKEMVVSALIITVALCRSLEEYMHILYESPVLRNGFKRDFNLLKNQLKKVHTSFEKQFAEYKEMLEAYGVYSDEFTELIYDHMDKIEEKMTGK